MPAWMLGADYLEHIHDALVVLLWPGTEPVRESEERDRSLIESAAARPFHSAFGQDAYPTILEKAVALFHSINANHAFLNGNKRTAVIAIDHFLMANDHFLVLPNEAMYTLAAQTASYKARGLSHDQSLAEITAGLQEHVISIGVIERATLKEPKYLSIVERFKAIRDFIRANKFNTLKE